MAVDAFGNIIPDVTVPGTGPLPAPLATSAGGESKIDPALRPYLEQGLQRAQQLFFTGAQPSLYPGQMYIGPSEQTQAALAQQEALARAQSPILSQAQQTFLSGLGATSAATPLYQNIYGAAGMRPGMDIYQQAAGGAFAPSTGRLEALYGQAGAQPAAGLYGQVAEGGFQNLALPGTAQTAAGSFLMGSPYQQQLIAAATRPLVQQYAEQVIPGISSQFSRAGRYGSGAMERAQGAATESFGRALGDITSGILGQEYARERGYQEAARQQLGALSQQDLANRLAAAGALQSAQQSAIAQQAGLAGQIAGLQQADVATRLAGAGGLEQAQQAALGTQLAATGGVAATQAQDIARQLAAAQAAPSFFQMGFLPSQALAQVGASREAIAAQPLQEAMQRYQFGQQLPYTQLQQYLSSVYGTPLASSQYQGIPQAQVNPLGQALGLGALGYLGGNLIGGQTFGMPTSTVGGLLGAGLGYFLR